MKLKYQRFLEGLRLRYFKPLEVINYGDAVRNGVRNSLPPEEFWPNLVPTLWVLDQFRYRTDLPVILTSIYRNPAYNRTVGGASGSWHMRNFAIDFQVRGMSPTVAFNRLLAMRQAGAFVGGLGKYSTFVHIDTRGTNATW